MRLVEIGEAWRPYRSVACWYLWESLKSLEPSPAVRRSVKEAFAHNSRSPTTIAISVPRSLKSVSRQAKGAPVTGRSRNGWRPRRQPSRDPRQIVAVWLAEPRRQKLFLPPNDGVILQSEQQRDRRHQPRKAGGQRQPEPERDIAQIEWITDPAKRTARHQRSQPVGARPRDRANLPDRPGAASPRQPPRGQSPPTRRLTEELVAAGSAERVRGEGGWQSGA